MEVPLAWTSSSLISDAHFRRRVLQGASAQVYVYTAAGVTALTNAGVAGAGTPLGPIAAGDVITAAHEATMRQATGSTLA
eukprot:2622547-Prymnesium_polylepis.1